MREFYYCMIGFGPQLFLLSICGSVFWAKYQKKVRAAIKEAQYAHCLCGERLSEWFIHQTDGCMWHPHAVRGCGWISPWATHEEYLAWIRVHKKERP